MSLLLRRSLATLFCSGAALLVTQTADAAIITLQNDSFVTNGNVGFQNGFVTGEMGASTLGPVSDTYTVQKVTFLYGPTGGGAQTITLRIYADTGGSSPGTQLFDADYQVTPSSDALQEIDLSADNVVVAGGSIRVAILFQNAGAPSIARDDDGINSGRNWIFNGAWTDSEDFLLTGDWIIRAEVDTMGTATTTSTGAGGGGGTTSSTGAGGGNGSGGGAAGTCTPGDTQACVGPGACDGGQSCNDEGTGWSTCECAEASGCGCKVPAEPVGGEGMAAGLGLLGLAATVTAVRRRRRR